MLGVQSDSESNSTLVNFTLFAFDWWKSPLLFYAGKTWFDKYQHEWGKKSIYYEFNVNSVRIGLDVLGNRRRRGGLVTLKLSEGIFDSKSVFGFLCVALPYYSCFVQFTLFIGYLSNMEILAVKQSLQCTALNLRCFHFILA